MIRPTRSEDPEMTAAAASASPHHDGPHYDGPRHDSPHLHSSRPNSERPHYSRRRFLLASGAVSAAGLLATAASAEPAAAAPSAPGGAAASGSSTTTGALSGQALADRVVFTRGTTLESAAAPVRSTGYTRLTAGAGYPVIVRGEALGEEPVTLADPDRRAPLASFVHLTDLHMIDAQSPMRFEYLHDITGSAFRPQEALGTQGGVSLVRRINGLARAPHTGRRFDCVVTTGDSTDNHEQIELDWFLTLMNGGRITPNTGAARRWEGVQTGGSSDYWRPENPATDRYKKAGFPTVPEFFRRAMATHTSPGLNVPWFSVFGNHDDSICGTLPSDWAAFADMYTGDRKFTGFRSASANRQLESQVRSRDAATTGRAPRITAPLQPADNDDAVTADPRRAPFTPVQFMQAHLAATPRVGPRGHGFTEENVATGRGYYSFEIAPGVVGIALDSTNRAGFTGGSIGHAQYRWLEKTLTAGSSTYYDGLGRAKKHSVEDTLFLVFSHHTPATMNNLLLEPGNPELRHAGWDVANLLTRFPNVLAWVNGHTHVNGITLHRHKVSRRSFWQINTASHVDFPQQARIIEVVDNRDGSLSLLTTLIESDAPYQGNSLATLYREYSYNDIHAEHTAEGTPEHRNTELLLVDPRTT